MKLEDEDAIRRRLWALGDEVEARWCGENYSEEPFPSLAAATLRDAALPSTLSLGDLLLWSLDTNRLPMQRDLRSRFGDPAITLYAGPRFCVEMYAWFEGTTALHQHSFAGAFQVLEGASIHGHYRFDTTRQVSPYFRFGQLALQGCDLLEEGTVQEIRPGSAYIHRLYHLDHPSATLVIRTLTSPGHQPQFSYLPPCVAMDPFFEDATAIKRLQCVSALHRAQHPEADAATAAWLERADIHTSFQILSMARLLVGRTDMQKRFGILAGDERFSRLLDVVRERHGKVADHFAAVFLAQDRHDRLVDLRGAITDPELRFFLALLLNVDDRQAILALVRQRFPGEDARGKILGWCGALARTRVMGASLPNALGVAGFDDFDQLILEHLLADATQGDILAAMAPDGEDASESQSVQLEARIARLRDAPVLRPLLQVRPA